MKRVKTDKGFDCIAFKQRAQLRVYENIKGLSSDQEIEYFRTATDRGPFAAWLKGIQTQRGGRRS